MNPEDAAKLIQQKLFETPGAVDEELIETSAELFGIDAVAKRVNFRRPGLSDRDRVVLYCLGMRLLYFVMKEPELAQVNRTKLAEELRIAANLVAAHASRLINEDPKPLRASKRGFYEVWIPAMKAYLAELKSRLAKKKD